MRRSTALHLASAVLVTLALALASNGCDDLKIAHSQGGADDPSSPNYEGGTDATDATTADGDGGTGVDANGPPAQRPYYADVQAALAAKRFAGPSTGFSSRDSCTPSYFVWVDFNSLVHSWRGATKARTDYGFADNGYHPYLFPSDAYFTFERPFVFLDVYRMDAPNTLVASIPYSPHFVTASNGVIRLDQKIDDVDIGGTKVRRWNATSMVTEDLTGVLPTREEPSSFVNDTLVLPGGTTAPYPLHIVDVVKKTASAVTFDNGLHINQTEQSESGLLVSYSNGAAALRLYKGNANTAAARVELGDDIDARPAYFEDPPTSGQEHDFRPLIATWGKKLFFASDFGIWSYDLASTVLQPVQLNKDKVKNVPNLLCVMRDAGLLVYRMSGDPTYQVWAVPLAALP